MTSSPPRSLVGSFVGALVGNTGAVLYWAAMFIPREDGKTLVSQGSQLAYNVPALTVLTIAAVIAWVPPARTHAGVTLFLVGVWTLVSITTSLSNGWDRGDNADLSAGVLLAIGGIILGVVGRARLRVDRSSLVWSGVAVALGAAWLLGEWMPWTKTTAAFTPVGSTNPRTHSSRCCIPFQDQMWQANVREALTMVLLIVAAMLLALVTPRSASGTGLAALAVVYGSGSASWLQQLAHPDVPRTTLLGWGMTASEIDTLHVTARMSGLFGGWLALAALVILALLGTFRFLAAHTTVHGPVTAPAHEWSSALR